MALECLVCGMSLGFFADKFPTEDGIICTDCCLKAGLNPNYRRELYTLATIKERIAIRERNRRLINNFKPTSTFDMISFDDNMRAFIITKRFTLNGKIQDLYFYDQVVDFELLEDGTTKVKGGLGRAAIGGLLFGGVGAIVGGITGGKKTESVCDSLQIKITLRNSINQTVYLDFINCTTKTSSFSYKVAYSTAQDAMSALQLAIDMVDNAPAEQPVIQQVFSGADEILKYKGLLDEGIITEEEFNAKKAQILGL